MPSTICRITVQAPGRRVDLALPTGVPIAELMLEVARLCLGEEAPEPEVETAPPAWTLARVGGPPFELASTLAEHGVVDGEVLHLVDVAVWRSPTVVEVREQVAAALEPGSVGGLGAWALASVATAHVLAAVALDVRAHAVGLPVGLGPGAGRSGPARSPGRPDRPRRTRRPRAGDLGPGRAGGVGVGRWAARGGRSRGRRRRGERSGGRGRERRPRRDPGGGGGRSRPAPGRAGGGGGSATGPGGRAGRPPRPRRPPAAARGGRLPAAARGGGPPGPGPTRSPPADLAHGGGGREPAGRRPGAGVDRWPARPGPGRGSGSRVAPQVALLPLRGRCPPPGAGGGRRSAGAGGGDGGAGRRPWLGGGGPGPASRHRGAGPAPGGPGA